MKTTVNPALLHWARKRARKSQADLAVPLGVDAARIPLIEQTGELTIRQLETWAKATYTPVGYLFLPEPPRESLPIPDFRTIGSASVPEPSPNLLDTIYLCQRRQEWYRDHALEVGAGPLAFVGSAGVSDDVEAVASDIRTRIRLNAVDRTNLLNNDSAISRFAERIEAAGILVMRNGVVGNNTHRPLSVEEFRGFVLCDEYAPLIFVNAADAKAAQMFTMAHELVHVWLGQSGVLDASIGGDAARNAERFCNAVAAEVLLPLDIVRGEWDRQETALTEARRLAKRYKVSSLVLLRRALDSGILDAVTFRSLYDDEVSHFSKRDAGGGNFYLTQQSRLGKRFATALVASTLEGRTLYREAFGLLGFSNSDALQKLARNLGVTP